MVGNQSSRNGLRLFDRRVQRLCSRRANPHRAQSWVFERRRSPGLAESWNSRRSAALGGFVGDLRSARRRPRRIGRRPRTPRVCRAERPAVRLDAAAVAAVVFRIGATCVTGLDGGRFRPRRRRRSAGCLRGIYQCCTPPFPPPLEVDPAAHRPHSRLRRPPPARGSVGLSLDDRPPVRPPSGPWEDTYHRERQQPSRPWWSGPRFPSCALDRPGLLTVGDASSPPPAGCPHRFAGR